MMGRRLTALAIFAAISAVSCSGGGGGNGGDSFVPIPVDDPSGTLDIRFIPDKANPDARDITLREESRTGSFVTIQVNVTAIEDVYSAGFDVTYDPTRLEFVNWLPGTLFELEGNTPIYSVSGNNGRVTVGATRSGGVEGANVQASRIVVRLTFGILRDGQARLDFENAFLLDSEPPAPSVIADTEWHGGLFDVIAP